MNNDRSPKECVDVVVRSINDWLATGICTSCALLVVASLLKVDHNAVETVWIDHNIDSEMALD